VLNPLAYQHGLCLLQVLGGHVRDEGGFHSSGQHCCQATSQQRVQAVLSSLTTSLPISKKCRPKKNANYSQKYSYSSYGVLQ
jgi:hypothetical protein